MNSFICSLILPFILISFTAAHSQRLPPILTKPFKPGVYKTYQEFVENKPSIREGFEIIPKSGDRKIEKGKGDYSLVMRAPAYQRKDLKKFWGASDGISVYVNECMYGRAFNLKKFTV